MPIGLSKDQEVWVTLSDDDGAPAFRCHFLTVREWLRLQDVEKQLNAATGEERFKLLWQMIRIGVTEWRNVYGDDGQPLDIAKADPLDLFTPQQLWDLKDAMIEAITERELSLRKKSASPANSRGDASTADAVTQASA